MSIQGDMAREDVIQSLCKTLAEKIEKYPDAAKALKEAGIEMLYNLPADPEWSRKYYQLFR